MSGAPRTGPVWNAEGALFSVDPVGVRELLTVTALIVLTLALAFGGRVAYGSFAVDDWSIHADLLYPRGGLSGTWSRWLEDPFGYRTLYWPYSALVHGLLGDAHRLYLALAAGSAAVLALLVHVLLRRLGIARTHAAAIAILGVAAPTAAMTKVWATAHVAHVAGALVVGGILVALHGATRPSASQRAQIATHTGALILMFGGVTMYEVALPWVALAGATYWWVAGRHAALPRWSADLAACGLWYLVARDNTFLGKSSEPLQRAWQTIGDGFELVAATLFPLSRGRLADDETRLVVVDVPTSTLVLALVMIAAALAWAWWSGGARGQGRSSRQFAILSMIGLTVAFASWVVIVPANEYYRPTGANLVNRVNVLAVFGLAACVYGAVVGAAAGASAVLGATSLQIRNASVIAGVGLTCILLAQAVELDRQYSVAWNRAGEEQWRTLGVIRKQFPDGLPPDAIVLLTNNVGITEEGAEVFFSNWPLRGALRYLYRDPTVSGYPTRNGAKYLCDRDGIRPYYIEYSGTADGLAPYGRVHLVDVAGNGRRWSPVSQAECRQALAEAGLQAPPAGSDLPAPGET